MTLYSAIRQRGFLERRGDFDIFFNENRPKYGRFSQGLDSCKYDGTIERGKQHQSFSNINRCVVCVGWKRGISLPRLAFWTFLFLPNGVFCHDLAQWRSAARTQVYVVLIFNYLIKIFRLLYNLEFYTFFIEWAIYCYLLFNISYGKLIHMKLLKSVSETI